MLDKTKVQTETIKCSILPQDKLLIQEAARKEHITISELIRRALKFYIESKELQNGTEK